MSVFFCDSDCELWYQDIERLGIEYIKMPYTIDGQETFYDMGKTTDFKDFYTRVRKGSMPITSALNPDMYEEIIEPYFAAGQDILYVAFGRTFSGTFEHLDTALKNLKIKYPDRKMTIFDTKMISVPSVIQFKYAAELWKNGASDEEIIAFLKEFTNHVGCFFAVDSLMHLHRGGRLSKFGAIAGSIMNLKPVLTFNENGGLSVYKKILGPKHVQKFLAEQAIQNARKLDKYEIYVLDADNEEGGARIAKLIKEGLPQANVVRQPVGPVIGTHCGPGTLAVIYYADQRVIPLKQEINQ